MKKFWVGFFKRGCMFSWGGPVILCVVWACLKGAGVIETVTVDTAVFAVMSTLVLAFVAAGISVVYQMEQLPKAIAALIQLAVLYMDYLIIYLLNGWMPLKAIGLFTAVFIAGFGIIWAIIYLTVKHSVNKINAQLHK
ncbi:MAG: DUF3021 domain-containing protein [Acutalibacteraceae bacterium]